MKGIIAGMWVAAVVLWAGMAGATDYTWTGLAGTAWTNGGNWSGGIGTDYPDGADDTALINSGAASTSITNSGNLTLGELTLDTGFSGTNTLGGSLTLSTAGGKSGNLTVNAGKLQTVRNAVGGISVAGAMTIGTGGVVIVRRSSTSGEGAGQTITAQNLVVEGSLNADKQGFSPNGGPGKGQCASHGGRGCGATAYLCAGSTYGSVTNPVSLGSGGSSYPDVEGGGAIVLVVANALTNNGLISANGNPNGGQAGAGGSVNITAATLAGTGVVQAIGGEGDCGAGGGRIAVVLTNGTDFGSVRFKAYGGRLRNSTSQYATAGTVYRKHAGHGSGLGELIIDNNGGNLETRNGYTELSQGGYVVHDFARVVITNGGNLAIRTNDTLNFNAAPNFVFHSPTQSVITLLSVSNVTFPNPFTLSTNYLLRIDAPVNASGSDWIVPAGAVLSHSGNDDVDTNRLQLALRNLTIEANGAINADAKGFMPDKGPGKYSSTANAGGASHGGGGGGVTATNSLGIATNTYGSVTNPITLGSGGKDVINGSGGGAIILTVVNALTNNGLISANSGSGNTRAGSGGSINITAGTVSGSGTNRVNGGGDNYGGAGGRIAIRLISGTTFGLITNQAWGGTGSGGTNNGAAGTVYLESAADGAGRGTVLVANSNRVSSTIGATTPLPAFAGSAEGLSKTKWTVDYKGKIGLVSNVTIGALTLVTTNAYLELAGKTLTVNSLSITGRQFAANTDGYTAAQLGTNNVTDVSPGAVGRIVVLTRQSGTLLLIR
jgi:hypothetical protein